MTRESQIRYVASDVLINLICKRLGTNRFHDPLEIKLPFVSCIDFILCSNLFSSGTGYMSRNARPSVVTFKIRLSQPPLPASSDPTQLSDHTVAQSGRATYQSYHTYVVCPPPPPGLCCRDQRDYWLGDWRQLRRFGVFSGRFFYSAIICVLFESQPPRGAPQQCS